VRSIRYIFDPADIREADRRAISKLGVSGMVLMENAGRGVADVMTARFPTARKFLFVCGPGNNGGDGLTAARHILIRGKEAVVILACSEGKLSVESLRNLDILKNIGCPVRYSSFLSTEEITASALESDIVVDALLGCGSAGAPRGEVLRVVEAIRGAGTVVALDVPTGVDPSDGRVEGLAVRAALTVTMLAEKTGLEIMPGREYCGDIEVVDIGVPPANVLPDKSKVSVFYPSDAGRILPKWSGTTHKGSRGLVLVVGGSARYRGAPVLSALGALRAGAGCVVVVAPEGSASFAGGYPELIFTETVCDGGHLSPVTWDFVMEKWGGRIDSVVAGPGMDRGAPAEALFSRIWREWDGPLCVDGDALHFLGRGRGPFPLRENTVITPHEGEAAFLLSKERSSVSGARLEAARSLFEKYGTCVLKGASSLVCGCSGVRVIPYNLPGLSVPGSGDVLSGVVGAMLGMGIEKEDAASSAACLHAIAGFLLQEEKGFDGILAKEIARAMPGAIMYARSGAGCNGQ
jgi:NAD(P)H-hydrate epimerase